MKVSQVSLLVLGLVVATLAKTDDEEWEAFKQKHGKVHKDAREEAQRKANFLKTHKKIKAHNSKAASFKMGHNEFSDWTAEEKKRLCGRKHSGTRTFDYNATADSLEMSLRQAPPTSLDYRNDSCMPDVKAQGGCGSCWAFASIAPLEFLVCKSTGQKISLSEQQLVDCACSGCDGGDYYPAWTFLSTTVGSVAANDYPYDGNKANCRSPSFTASQGLIKPVSWARVDSAPTAIMTALKTYGVLAIAMDVQDSFSNYASGVYDANDCKNGRADLNHAMDLVGYGTDGATGLDYWVVRNSWGNGWGVDGYILVRRGVNTCGVESDVGYVKTNLPITL